MHMDVVLIAVLLFRQLSIDKVCISISCRRACDGFLSILLLLNCEKAFAKDYVFTMDLQDVMQSCNSARKERNKLRCMKIVYRYYRCFSQVLILT